MDIEWQAPVIKKLDICWVHPGGVHDVNRMNARLSSSCSGSGRAYMQAEMTREIFTSAD